ncbi:MAG: NADH-quinone oxidoreductase subunit L [Rickettsiaceae bacterium]|nr:NADH-quinone oxidoreductase subunit L [Rickettsiaceae bacterium]
MESLAIALPLFAGLFCGLFNKVLSKELVSAITCTSISIAAIVSLNIFYNVIFFEKLYKITLWTWLSAASFKADIVIYIDKLTAIMFVVVTFVSSMVHIYSTGYMKEDENMPKFMSYISIFTASMLILVSSDNFAQLFLGWEGVGVCSYLLIGFWHERESANNAAIKAFIVNRIADFALITCIIILYSLFGTLEYQRIFANITNEEYNYIQMFGHEVRLLEFASFLLFIGCMGKSAQIGLHVWLPDAMEGPTPVSALIHAATMVTAGVFLLARCSFLIESAPYCKEFITIIGSLTVVMAGLIATGQDDIKKIIAYSTCSQLGYMFVACGLGQYHLGIFHLFTHAFFKAMLFLGAGSIIHAMHHEQDTNKMGGLVHYMPLTHIFFWIGSLAIMGIYPFAGYFSKDMIIEAAYHSSHVAYLASMIGAFCTSIYSIKILQKVFYNHKSFSDAIHPHEPGAAMNFPMMLLAACAIFAGIFGSSAIGIGMDSRQFYEGIIITSPLEQITREEHSLEEIILTQGPTLVAILGAIIGFFLFYQKPGAVKAKDKNRIISQLLLHKFYFDEFYENVVVKLSDKIAKFMKIFDKEIIDAFGPGFISNIIVAFSRALSFMHGGVLNIYASMFTASIAVFLCIMLYLFVL